MTHKNQVELLNCPVLVLTFNRPNLFQECLGRLVKFGFENIWVSVDGPRIENNQDLIAHNTIIDICKKFKINDHRINLSSINKGCRNGVMYGLDWFFNENEFGIVIEDDIEIYSEYLYVIPELLETYKNSNNIFSISCNNFLKDNTYKSSNSIFYSPVCRVWGWATWSNRWFLHKRFIQSKLSTNPFKCFFSLPSKYRGYDAALRLSSCQLGIHDTWDYEWNFSHIYSHGYSLTPSGLFCLNHGFTPNATHTKNLKSPWDKMDKMTINSNYKLIKIGDSLIKSICIECGFRRIRFWPYQFMLLVVKILHSKLIALMKM